MIERLLETGRESLANRIIKILPEEIPLTSLKASLLQKSRLTKEAREALLAKSATPSLDELLSYYSGAMQYIRVYKDPSDGYKHIQLDTLQQLRSRVPLEEIEKEYILAALDLNAGNQTQTAEQLKIGSATLYRKLKSYGLIGVKRLPSTPPLRS